MSNYGKKISELRKKNNLTQADLGAKLNVSAQAVSKWENGLSEPDIQSLKNLCIIFNISLDELLDVETQPAKPTESESIEKTSNVNTTTTPEQAVKIIYGYCEKCKKPVGPNEYQVTDLRYTEKGSVVNDSKQHVFCNNCHKVLLADQKKQQEQDRQFQNERNKLEKKSSLKKGLLFGILFALIGAIVTFSAYFYNPSLKLLLFAIFTTIGSYMLSALMFWDCYVTDVFAFFCRSFKAPFGLIFQLSLDGIIWLITVKLALWIICGLLSVLFFLVGLFVSMALSIVSFPFILTKKIKNI